MLFVIILISHPFDNTWHQQNKHPLTERVIINNNSTLSVLPMILNTLVEGEWDDLILMHPQRAYESVIYYVFLISISYQLPHPMVIGI